MRNRRACALPLLTRAALLTTIDLFVSANFVVRANACVALSAQQVSTYSSRPVGFKMKLSANQSFNRSGQVETDFSLDRLPMLKPWPPCENMCTSRGVPASRSLGIKLNIVRDAPISSLDTSMNVGGVFSGSTSERQEAQDRCRFENLGDCWLGR